jgi:hypothetical protein
MRHLRSTRLRQQGGAVNQTFESLGAKESIQRMHLGVRVALSCLLKAAIRSPRRPVRRQAAGDEVFTARCDLEISRHNKETMFNFAQHRRVEHIS